MRFGILYIVGTIVLITREVIGFEFLRELLFPRAPSIKKVRDLEEARALGDEFAILDTVSLI